jgi:hypothetical protein
MLNSIGDFILSSLVPHVCSTKSCGYGIKLNHAGCFELSSDDFIKATQRTAPKANGNPLAPD